MRRVVRRGTWNVAIQAHLTAALIDLKRPGGVSPCDGDLKCHNSPSLPTSVPNLDKIDLVKAELEKLIPVTRAEEGCIQYDLHQDNENPAHFMFYENWVSRELWQVHMNAPHLAAYVKATEGAVAEFTV